KGVLMHDVWEVPFVVAHSHEQLGYPTQKPIELLGRILDATTEPGDWVADFFAGSGAFLAAAEGMRVTREGIRTRHARRAATRRWLAADASPQAVHATRKRLLALPGPAAAFEVWVLATAAPAAAAAGGRANAANGRPAVPHVQAS